MGLDVYVGNIGFVGYPDDYPTPELYRDALQEADMEDAFVRHMTQRLGGVRFDWALRGPEDKDLIERVGPYSSLHYLRRYAAHIDVHGRAPQRPLQPDDTDDPETGEVMARIAEFYADWTVDTDPPPSQPPPSRFSHLLWHSDADGYYVPSDFLHPAFAVWDGRELSIGSSVRLLTELDAINEWLMLEQDLGQLTGDSRRTWEEALDEDPWAIEKWVWSVLHWMARESVSRNQPMVYG